MTYSATLYLSHTLQDFKDLFDPKSCELPTLVENDMPNKPMESYALISHGTTMGVRDPHSTLIHLILSKFQLAKWGKTSHYTQELLFRYA